MRGLVGGGEIMKTHYVFCKDCRKELAFWSMFDNLQYEEEWECNGKFRRKAHNVFKSKNGKRVSCFVMDGGANTVIDSPESNMRRVKYEMWPCSLSRNTKYCRKCAQRRHFKCGAHKCKGKIVKVKNKDGTNTKHSHGGW